jgi:hypothetical protein
MCYTFQKRKSPPLEEEKRAKPRKDHPGPEYFFKNLRIGELLF